MNTGASEAESSVRIAMVLAEESVKISTDLLRTAAKAAVWTLLKIIGPGIRNIALFIASLLKNNGDVIIGKTSLRNLLARGEGVQLLSLPKSSYKQFQQGAKQYGVPYAQIRLQENSSAVEIMVPESAIERLNYALRNIPHQVLGNVQPDPAAEQIVEQGLREPEPAPEQDAHGAGHVQDTREPQPAGDTPAGAAHPGNGVQAANRAAAEPIEVRNGDWIVLDRNEANTLNRLGLVGGREEQHTGGRVLAFGAAGVQELGAGQTPPQRTSLVERANQPMRSNAAPSVIHLPSKLPTKGVAR